MDGSAVTNGNGPDPALFLVAPGGQKGNGKWQLFIAALEPMVPVRVPEGGDRSGRAINTAAHNLGVRVALRTYNGELWACLIPDDEVEK